MSEPVSVIADRLLQDAIALDIRLGDPSVRKDVSQGDVLKMIEHLRRVYYAAGRKW